MPVLPYRYWPLAGSQFYHTDIDHWLEASSTTQILTTGWKPVLPHRY
ncbi:MAG: hypothetical protein F6K63_32845 [Moorea sp. SIO1G6]|nr:MULTISPECIES: hypothetical protein [unclassified Moorena]NEQ08844.1 hypothetical protein [Moorena sp. SIO4E2]NET68928.1 hypothetical protein [Moorena sp. SIO1G6]